MLKRYKLDNKILIQAIRTWKELAVIVKKAEKAGYKYMGFEGVEKIGLVAVFKKSKNFV